MASDGETTYLRLPGAGSDPGAELTGDGARADANELYGPCKQCGGLGTHYLTCPLLQLPSEPESAP
jgi:hypothetical protein